MRNINSLPRKIIIDILSRVPVKSLLKLKCVCKQWFMLLSHPSFIDMHRSRLQNIPGLLIIVDYGVQRKLFSVQEEEPDRYKTAELPYQSEIQDIGFVSACNGLVCFTKANPDHGPVRVFNPATQEMTALPRNSHGNTLEVTLGFDPKNKRYKVFRLFYRKDPHLSEYEVFTLGIDDLWRYKGSNHYGQVFNGYHILTGGTLYFRFSHYLLSSHDDEDFYPDCILSINIHDEGCQQIPFPMELGEDGRKSYFVELRERLCLCLMRRSKQFSGRMLDMWILSTNNQSWLKERSIRFPNFLTRSIICPLPVRNNEILMMEGSTDTALIFYKLEPSSSRMIFPTPKEIWPNLNIIASNYVESLVPGKVYPREVLLLGSGMNEAMDCASYDMGNIDALPKQIIVDILSRLPVKSLLKLKCVCKQWSTLISHSSFIDMHLSQFQNRPGFLIIVDYADERKLFSMQEEGPASYRTAEMPYLSVIHDMGLLSVCNGLICFTRIEPDEGPVCIYNPVTREMIALPRSLRCNTLEVSLGYDPKDKIYKAFRLFHRKDPHLPEHEVFSLSIDDSWRCKGSNLYGRIFNDYHHIHAGGTLNFMFARYVDSSTNNADLGPDAVLSINIHNEDCQEIPFPVSPGEVGYGDPYFVELRKHLSLCMICESTMGMWVLSDNKQYWVKECSIFLPSQLADSKICPLPVRNNEILMMPAGKNKDLIFFELEPASFRIVDTTSMECWTDGDIIATNYVESLVPVKNSQ